MPFTTVMPPLRETLHQWQARALEKGTKQASMFAVGIPFIVITSTVVIMRIHVRLSLLKVQLAADDCKLNVLAHAEKGYTYIPAFRSDACWYLFHNLALSSEHDM